MSSSSSAPRPGAPRSASLHAADRIACPKCGAPIRRLTAGAGAFVATCDQRSAPRPGERFGRPCSQASYVSTSPDGVATVIPLTRDELEILRALPVIPPQREALELLGAIRRHTPDRIPSARCVKCEELHQLTDLYGGHCRRCAGLAPGNPPR